MSDSVKYFETIIPTKLEIATYEPNNAEYYTSPDFDGVIYKLIRFRKLTKTDFRIDVSICYWRMFPEKNKKYKLFSDYKIRVFTERGTLFDEGINVETISAFTNIVKFVLKEMIAFFNTQSTDQIFELPNDAELVRIGQDLARNAKL